MAGILVRSVLALILGIAWSDGAWTGEGQNQIRNVVILTATDLNLPAFVALDGAQREAIRAGSIMPVEFYAEALDMHRFPQKLLNEELVSLLKKKYRDIKVDALATTAPIALDFAQRYGAEIWPGATIVFQGVAATVLHEQSLDPRTIGVPMQLDFGQTLDLALKLRPAARRIAVIAGAEDPCCGRSAFLSELLKRYAETFDIQYLVGLSVADTVRAVRALPEDAVVLYGTVFRDGDGVPHVPRDVLKTIAAVSPAPVFGVFETYLGHGIAAGLIASFERQGQISGELVARVLNGEDPSAIAVQAPVESRCIADARQLRHWGIDENLLPRDCEVRFREATAWDRYHWQIVITLAVVLVQAALIFGLMLNRRRLGLTQTALMNEHTRRRDIETVAARLRGRIARFSKERSLGVMATTIAHEINQPLIAIQNYAQAARRRLQSNVDDKPRLIELFGKIEGQAERAGAITERVRSLVNSDEPQLRPTSVGPLCEEVIRIMQAESEARRCRISCDVDVDLPPVIADALQLQLVLVNLLSNALRSVSAVKEGSRLISIDARVLDDRAVQVSITDRGTGIPPERVPNIFPPLYSDTHAGMGMGLAICEDIIGALGGRIWYEPNPAGGAIFRFTLRVAG